jgi:hypothetical protein
MLLSELGERGETVASQSSRRNRFEWQAGVGLIQEDYRQMT